MKTFYYTAENEDIWISIDKCIKLARKHNCKVILKSVDIKLTINKRLSRKHVYNTYTKMVKARISKLMRDAFGVNNAILKRKKK